MRFKLAFTAYIGAMASGFAGMTLMLAGYDLTASVFLILAGLFAVGMLSALLLDVWSE